MKNKWIQYPEQWLRARSRRTGPSLSASCWKESPVLQLERYIRLYLWGSKFAEELTWTLERSIERFSVSGSSSIWRPRWRAPSGTDDALLNTARWGFDAEKNSTTAQIKLLFESRINIQSLFDRLGRCRRQVLSPIRHFSDHQQCNVILIARKSTYHYL